MKQKLLRIGKWVGISLLSLVILICIVLSCVVLTQYGRSTLINTGIDIVNSRTPWQINKKVLSMPSLGRLAISDLAVSYKQKPVVHIKGGFIQWRPSQLFSKKIIVNTVKLNGVTTYLDHLPQGQNPPKEENNQPFKITDLDAIKQRLPHVVIQSINITHVNLNRQTPENTPLQIFTLYTYHVLGQLSLKQNAPIQSQLELRTLRRDASTKTHNTEAVVNFIQTSQNTIKLSLNIAETEPGFFTRLLKIQNDTDQLFNANMNAAVTLDNGLKLDLSSLTLPVSNTTLTATGKIESDIASQVIFSNMAITLNEQTHTLEGKISRETANLSAELNQFNVNVIKPWLPDIDRGVISASVNMKGAWDQLIFSTKASGNIVYLSVPTSFNTQLMGENNIIDINTLTIKSQKANINVNGQVNLNNKTINTQFNVVNVVLAPYKPVINRFIPDNPYLNDLKFNLDRAQGQVTGSLSNPFVNITAKANGAFKAETFNFNIASTVNKNRIKLTEFIFNIAQSRTQVTGNIDLRQQTINADVDINEVPFMLANLAGIDLPPSLTGQLSTNLILGGSFSEPSIRGEAYLAGQFDAIPFQYEQDINFNKKTLIIEQASLNVFDENVLDMSIDMNADTIDTQVHITNLPAKLLNLLPFTLNEGDLDADIRIKGPLLLPDVNAQLRYDSFVLVQNDNEANTKTPYTFALDIATNSDKVLNIEVKANTENNDPAVLSVVAPLNPLKRFLLEKNKTASLPLDVSIEGLLNLRTVQLFMGSNVHEFDGEIILDAQLNGDLNTPVATGRIQLDKAAYAHAVHGTELKNLRCILDFQQQSASINNCDARDGDDGRFSINGRILYPFTQASKYGDIDLNMTLDNMRLINRKEITSQTSGNMNIEGNINALTVSGDLDITPLSASIESAPPVSIPSIEVTQVESFDAPTLEQNTPSPLMPIINLDIKINATNQAFLRGRGLDAELGGSISIYGTAQEPQYDGEFTVARGHIELFNKKFDLTGGKVTLATQAIGLNIVGSYIEDGQRINVILSGRADDIKIDFTAQPTLPEDEILAFIIFGKNITEITSIEALQLASAVRQLQGGGGFDVIASTRDALGVDNLSFESGDEGLNIGVGKYINERVYLEVQKTPDPSQPWLGNITIDLLPNLKLESSTGGNSGVQGATLKWKNDY